MGSRQSNDVILVHFWVHLHGIAVDKASIVPDFGIQPNFKITLVFSMASKKC